MMTRRRTSKSDELRRNVVPPVGVQPSGGQTAARQSSLAGSVTIVPDQLTNSLLIRASARDFDVIKDAVDQLDIRPLQPQVPSSESCDRR